MDVEVKQRNRRRKRAQRMQRESKANSKHPADSGEEDSESAVLREKPQRPPARRKKSKEPIVEEDIIDGFSILAFRTYDDLESVIKLASKDIKRLLEDKTPRVEHHPRPQISHHISSHQHVHLDAGTSDDSGRASERLTGSSLPPRDADSSRDRLSDTSSRCSSGKGYICDSEGDDDKGSDDSSVIFDSAPASRKHEFPGALPPSLPPTNGASNSPVPAPTPPNLPTPSPAPAQQPPVPVAAAIVPPISAATACKTVTPMTATPETAAIPMTATTMPQAAAATPVAHHPLSAAPPPALGRTESPAVATSANLAAAAPTQHTAASTGGHFNQSTPYQPLYAPYATTTSVSYPSRSPPPPPTITDRPAIVTPTTSVTPTAIPTTLHHPAVAVVTCVVVTAVVSNVAVSSSTPSSGTSLTSSVTSSANHRDVIVCRSSPKVHSPARERESYSNVTSLSRSSVVTAPLTCPPSITTASSSSLITMGGKPPWSGSVTSQLSPVPPRPAHPPPPAPVHSSFPQPMFAAPLPPTVTRASPLTSSLSNQPPPNPFSAESLFQTNQTDMLRRELDNRFLAAQDRTLNVGPPPYLRTEMHQHQHHHTHVHQHTTSILPPPPTASTLFPSPIFKDIPKLGGIDSPFYRQNLGLPSYPSYSPSLLHPGLTGPTPFMPPNHVQSFQPKPRLPLDPTKSKTMKTGKWNAMHVRIAWEVYHHQQKEAKGAGAVKPDLLRTPSHLFPPSAASALSRPHDLAFPPTLAGHRPSPYDQHHPGSIFGSAASHLGSAISPFARYGSAAGFNSGSSAFLVSSRELSMGPLHDPWRGLQRTVPTFHHPSVNALPPTVSGLAPPAPWTLKPDPVLEQQREREERERAERERLRREREERERREREEKQRKLEQQQQEQRERERREKERREMERRELERQQERERMLHQQRLVESSKQLMSSSVMRDRSPLRNGTLDHHGDIRVKEEPRIKEEDRYNPYARPSHNPMTSTHLPSVMDRSRVLPPTIPPPYAPGPPTTAHWPPHSADPYYRAYEPLRYNPLMDAAIRAEEERAKLFGMYPPPAPPANLRPKDPGGLMHLRAMPGPGPPLTVTAAHKMCNTAPPPNDIHKKEEPR
ncbi:autism susceptibility gene 2 protein isoform X2 [Agrilus planipennis]|uniref:Autism susceptibility gene 2 protein isoform X2 n=1 Tax=Agrilus planipennis TaxID=224129 RepID=A0A1W4WF23_AGRPL|nr:autism susceptibility gene 2 protein isoform X2 [Agrilus planipennis]